MDLYKSIPSSKPYDTTFDCSGRGLTCVWMDRNYNWSDPAFRDRVGESLNLAVNLVADVLYTLYAEYQAALSEAFDFSVTVTPAAACVWKGAALTFTVNVERLKGAPETVSLSVSGLPAGATYSFNVPSGQPPFVSLLTVTTPPGTPAGTYLVTIEASVGNLTRTAYITLTVTDSGQQGLSSEQILMAAFAFAVVAAFIGIVLKLRKR